MATVKITQLEHISDLREDDVLVIDDVSIPRTHKLSISNLQNYLGNVQSIASELNSYAQTANTLISNLSNDIDSTNSNLTAFALHANTNAAALASSIASITLELPINADSGNSTITIGEDSVLFTGSQGLQTQVDESTVTIRLANTSVEPGTYGNAFVIPQIVVDNQGRITGISENAIDFSLTQQQIDNVVAQIGNLSLLETSETANLVEAINSVNQKNTFANVTIGNLHIDTDVKTHINSTGDIVSSFDKAYRFAKLIIHVEDITYGQYQSSEVLLIQDGSTVRLTEYAIVFTSTNPICTFEASSNTTSVSIFAKPQSSDNTITVIKLLS
jgi:hypothetical protein